MDLITSAFQAIGLFLVTNIDDKEHRVVMSIRVYHKSTEKQALEDFRNKAVVDLTPL